MPIHMAMKILFAVKYTTLPSKEVFDAIRCLSLREARLTAKAVGVVPPPLKQHSRRD